MGLAGRSLPRRTWPSPSAARSCRSELALGASVMAVLLIWAAAAGDRQPAANLSAGSGGPPAALSSRCSAGMPGGVIRQRGQENIVETIIRHAANANISSSPESLRYARAAPKWLRHAHDHARADLKLCPRVTGARDEFGNIPRFGERVGERPACLPDLPLRENVAGASISAMRRRSPRAADRRSRTILVLVVGFEPDGGSDKR